MSDKISDQKPQFEILKSRPEERKSTEELPKRGNRGPVKIVDRNSKSDPESRVDAQ